MQELCNFYSLFSQILYFMARVKIFCCVLVIACNTEQELQGGKGPLALPFSHFPLIKYPKSHSQGLKSNLRS